MKLQNSEWMFMSQLIYRLNNTTDFKKFCYTFLEQIQILIPHSEGGVYRMKRKAGEHYPFLKVCTGSNSNRKFFSNIDISDSDCFWAEYLYSPWSVVFRHSDIEAAIDFEKTDLYQRIFVPLDIHYAIKAILIHEDRLCGVISLFRPKTQENFSDRDVFILNMLKDHIAMQMARLLPKTAIQYTAEDVQSMFQEVATKYDLTKREEEILSIIVKSDESVEEISKKLFISPSTLKKHIYNIYTKMKVKNRMQLRKLINQL